MNNAFNDFDNLLSEFDSEGLKLLTQEELTELDRLTRLTMQEFLDTLPLNVLGALETALKGKGTARLDELDLPEDLKRQLRDAEAAGGWRGSWSAATKAELQEMTAWLKRNQERVEGSVGLIDCGNYSTSVSNFIGELNRRDSGQFRCVKIVRRLQAMYGDEPEATATGAAAPALEDAVGADRAAAL